MNHAGTRVVGHYDTVTKEVFTPLSHPAEDTAVGTQVVLLGKRGHAVAQDNGRWFSMGLSLLLRLW